MYVNSSLQGFLPGLTSRVSSVANAVKTVALAPVNTVKAAVTGGSISNAVTTGLAPITKPAVTAVKQVAPAIVSAAIAPVAITQAALTGGSIKNAALNTLVRPTLNTASQIIGAKSAANAVAPQIVQSVAPAPATVTTPTPSAAPTANAAIGAQTAANQAANASPVAPSVTVVTTPGQAVAQPATQYIPMYQPAPAAEKPATNWGAIAAATVAAISLLKG